MKKALAALALGLDGAQDQRLPAVYDIRDIFESSVWNKATKGHSTHNVHLQQPFATYRRLVLIMINH